MAYTVPPAPVGPHPNDPALAARGITAYLRSFVHHFPPTQEIQRPEHTGTILYYEFRGHGAPPDDIGNAGDVYLDAACALYCRGAARWEPWAAGTLKKSALLPHPYLADRFLWCSAKKIVWYSGESIRKDRKQRRILIGDGTGPAHLVGAVLAWEGGVQLEGSAAAGGVLQSEKYRFSAFPPPRKRPRVEVAAVVPDAVPDPPDPPPDAPCVDEYDTALGLTDQNAIENALSDADPFPQDPLESSDDDEDAEIPDSQEGAEITRSMLEGQLKELRVKYKTKAREAKAAQAKINQLAATQANTAAQLHESELARAKLQHQLMDTQFKYSEEISKRIASERTTTDLRERLDRVKAMCY